MRFRNAAHFARFDRLYFYRQRYIDRALSRIKSVGTHADTPTLSLFSRGANLTDLFLHDDIIPK